MWRKFRLLSFPKQIGLTVLLFHLLCLFLIDHSIHRKRPQRKIGVRTVIPKAISTIAPAPAIKPKAAPQQKPNLPPKKRAPAKSKKEPTPAASIKKAALLQELAENLKSLTSSETTPPSRQLQLPKSIPSRTSPDEEATFDPTYGEALSAYLQDTLDLPEYGEVKAKLTIGVSGELLHFEIIESRSKKNSEFLKKRLPELSFPCFNDLGNLKTIHNFTVTFSNVENP